MNINVIEGEASEMGDGQAILTHERRLEAAEWYRSKWLAARQVIASAAPSERADVLGDWAKRTRRSVVSMILAAQNGHIGGDFSVADILTTAYLAVLKVDPLEPSAPWRDRFILSKGHCTASLYSTLAFAGFFDPGELSTFMQPRSALNGHPNRNEVPGVETNTGPLGHGLPVGVGAAIGSKLRGGSVRVIVVTGDGELQEGSNWEAFMAASQFGLDNLTVVVDRNRLQQGSRTEETNRLEPLEDKLAAFGWDVEQIDGHDFDQLVPALSRSGSQGRPHAVIANTIKGKGVSFIEDRVEWHHKVPTDEEARLALEELS